MGRGNATFGFWQLNNRSIFEVLSSKMDGGDETKLIVFCGYSVILTITFCLARTWQFLPRLSYLFAFLLSWFAGYVVRNWTPYNSDKLVESCFSSVELAMIIPILVFHYTLRIDYYTLGRILGPVVFVSCSLFAANVGILSIVMYSISELGSPYEPKLLHALILSMITATHAVNMLERVRGRVRQLQILLQGEILISLGLFCYLNNILLKFLDFNRVGIRTSAEAVLVYMVWHVLGIFPGLLAAYLFKQFVRRAYDDCAGQGVCCISCIIVIYCLCEILGICGSLSVLAFGVSLGTSKIKFNKRTARYYYNSDRALTFLASSIIFVYCGFYIGLTHSGYKYYQASYIFIVFATCMTTRVITFVLIHRMIGMLNQITWRHLTVGVQSASRGAILLAFSLNYIAKHKLHEGRQLLIDNVILVCYSYVFNIALLGPVLEAMGINDLTRPKIINMNWALSLVNICRSRAIESLQVDRVIADANWVVVDQSTILRHPYKHSKKRSIQASYKDFEEEFDAKGRIISCGNCGAKGGSPTV
ncbi:unnamed protein product [Nesidiocoris tenuis]|uniref:Cation/H+ exchanger transmembrane domain-containing protein n=1 Tax=Nesidiocoris tenuis TaxID=355587 RepID=A0A6H5HRC4_9HEMI|nr:unnamed protein product [Nesidiocoris tenuis]